MGVQRERVKRVGDLPAWFQLRKYDKLIDLNAAGWFEQLMVREKLVRILSAVGKASMPDEGFAEIHEFVGELAGCFFDDTTVGNQ